MIWNTNYPRGLKSTFVGALGQKRGNDKLSIFFEKISSLFLISLFLKMANF